MDLDRGTRVRHGSPPAQGRRSQPGAAATKPAPTNARTRKAAEPCLICLACGANHEVVRANRPAKVREAFAGVGGTLPASVGCGALGLVDVSKNGEAPPPGLYPMNPEETAKAVSARREISEWRRWHRSPITSDAYRGEGTDNGRIVAYRRLTAAFSKYKEAQATNRALVGRVANVCWRLSRLVAGDWWPEMGKVLKSIESLGVRAYRPSSTAMADLTRSAHRRLPGAEGLAWMVVHRLCCMLILDRKNTWRRLMQPIPSHVSSHYSYERYLKTSEAAWRAENVMQLALGHAEDQVVAVETCAALDRAAPAWRVRRASVDHRPGMSPHGWIRKSFGPPPRPLGMVQ